MTGHHQTTITLSVFSARRFYSSAPLTSPQSTLIHHATQIPSAGILRAPASSDRPGSLVWMDGLAVQASRTRAFVDSLRRGEIPKPLTQTSSLPAHIQVRYLSPTNMALSGHTLVSVLGLATPLLHILESSNYRACGACGNRLKMYASAAELTEEILGTYKDQGIDIRLRAPADLLAEWSEALGFGTCESADDGGFVELDSLIAKPENFQRVRKVLDLAWTLPDMSVWCRSDHSTTAYAPHGYCAHCYKGAPAISRRNLGLALVRGVTDLSSPELLLYTRCVTLRDLMTLPLSTLDELQVLRDILPPNLREALWGFGLDCLALGRTTDTLSASALARLSVIAAMANSSKGDSLTVLDIPSRLMSSSESSRALDILEHSARRGTIVVLERHDERPRETVNVDIPEPTKLNLGTLRLHARDNATARETDLLRGSCRVIALQDDLSVEPLAREISAALSGKQVRDVTYSSRHPCEVRLIDIHSRASSPRRILAQELGLYEPLTKLYASALEARVRGLTPKDFNLSTRSKPNYLCPECSGVGIILELVPDFERPEARACPICLGTRFRAPIKEIEFRGRALWRVLNSTFHEESGVLRALPKVSKALSLLSLLELDHLPIGMPTSLLSFSERRLTAIATGVLSGTSSRPAVLVIEEPLAGLSPEQTEGVTKLMSGHELSKDVTWIVVTHAGNGTYSLTTRQQLSTESTESAER